MMNQNIKRSLSVLITLMMSTAVCARHLDQLPNKQATPIYRQEKQNIMVTAGQPEFTYQLKSNPTTGYAWFLREYNERLIIPLKHRFQAGEHPLMGTPGYELWTFKMKPAGFTVPQQTLIRLVYARPWQSDDSATQLILQVTTEVKETHE
jgi:inhibitor of cysteine peptidase